MLPVNLVQVFESRVELLSSSRGSCIGLGGRGAGWGGEACRRIFDHAYLPVLAGSDLVDKHKYEAT